MTYTVEQHFAQAEPQKEMAETVSPTAQPEPEALEAAMRSLAVALNGMPQKAINRVIQEIDGIPQDQQIVVINEIATALRTGNPSMHPVAQEIVEQAKQAEENAREFVANTMGAVVSVATVGVVSQERPYGVSADPMEVRDLGPTGLALAAMINGFVPSPVPDVRDREREQGFALV